MTHYENDKNLIKTSDKFIGGIFKSNQYGEFKVIGINKLYHGKLQTIPYYICKFLNTGYECLALGTAINNGSVKDNYFKSVYGVGYLGDYDGSKNKHPLYKTWVLMLGRCYNVNYPDYRKDCFVCDEWLNFSNFISDCPHLLGYKDMINNLHIKYSLDKDFICQGNSVYSKDKCCFIPQDLNSFILNTVKNRSYFFEGVYVRGDNGMFRASIRYNGKTKSIPQSDNPTLVHEAYWKEKRKIAEELLNEKYNFIDEEIKEIVFLRINIKHLFSKSELERAIAENYFNNKGELA